MSHGLRALRTRLARSILVFSRCSTRFSADRRDQSSAERLFSICSSEFSDGNVGEQRVRLRSSEEEFFAELHTLLGRVFESSFSLERVNGHLDQFWRCSIDWREEWTHQTRRISRGDVLGIEWRSGMRSDRCALRNLDQQRRTPIRQEDRSEFDVSS